jgi:hypothetical protein
MEEYHEKLGLLQRQLETYFGEKLAALDAERAKVEVERTTALEAIAQLRRSISGNEVVQPWSGGPQLVSLRHAVYIVIRDFIVGDFNINTVIDLIVRHYPEVKQPINPTSVSGALRSLQKEGVLKLVKHGAGPRPSIYRLAQKLT